MFGGLACYAFGILRILYIPVNSGLAIVNLVTRQPWRLAYHLHIEFEGAFDQPLRAVKPKRELPSLVEHHQGCRLAPRPHRDANQSRGHGDLPTPRQSRIHVERLDTGDSQGYAGCGRIGRMLGSLARHGAAHQLVDGVIPLLILLYPAYPCESAPNRGSRSTLRGSVCRSPSRTSSSA